MAANVAAYSWLCDEILELDYHEHFRQDFDLSVVAAMLRDDHSKVANYWEETVPEYLPCQLRKELRVPTSVFNHVIDNIGDDLRSNCVAGREAVQPDKKLAIFMQYLGSRNTIFDIAQKYGVCQYTVIKCRRQCSQVLVERLMKPTVCWPRDSDQEGNRFSNLGPDHFPRIVGALDGCHIPISTPLIDSKSYFNRKKFYSINIQGVVNSDCIFTNTSIGQPGRRHDAYVLRNSGLWETGYNLCGQGTYHLIADSAYPITRWLLTPYRNFRGLTREQKAFNTALSRRRQVIERAYGMLKARFRRLKLGIEMFNMEEINRLIMSGIILHNLCTMAGDDPLDLPQYNDDVQDPRLHPVPNVIIPRNATQEGILKRQVITNNL